MKIGIIADVHGRYEALKTAIQRLKGLDGIINLGDVANYDDRVNDCYNLLREKSTINFLGNHEIEALAPPREQEGGFTLLDQSGNARQSDFGVSEKVKSFIRTWKTHARLRIGEVDYSFCHGYPVGSGVGTTFEYLSKKNLRSFHQRFGSDVVFCGHLHRSQVIWGSKDDTSRSEYVEKPKRVHLESGCLYGFNVGMLSTDQQHPERLQYCVLDTEEKKVEYVFTQ